MKPGYLPRFRSSLMLHGRTERRCSPGPHREPSVEAERLSRRLLGPLERVQSSGWHGSAGEACPRLLRADPRGTAGGVLATGGRGCRPRDRGRRLWPRRRGLDGAGRGSPVGAIPRALATATVAVPRQRPALATTARRVQFVTRKVERLDAQRVVTDITAGGSPPLNRLCSTSLTAQPSANHSSDGREGNPSAHRAMRSGTHRATRACPARSRPGRDTAGSSDSRRNRYARAYRRGVCTALPILPSTGWSSPPHDLSH